MKISQRLACFRNRSVWTDPVRRVRTLESFAETEADGGRDLLTAARRISDPDLRVHIEHHAEDEVRHARLFRERAAELRADIDLGSVRAEESDSSYDLSRGRKGVDVDAHGFFSASLCDELGEVAYVAMLHVAEQRARDLFEMHSHLNRHDEKTKAVFDEILKDEKYHVSYTRKFLDKWSQGGREVEVKGALKDARSSRFMGAWKRVGVRSAAGFSKVLLRVLYWTVLQPFGWLARRSQPAPAWKTAATSEAKSQY